MLCPLKSLPEVKPLCPDFSVTLFIARFPIGIIRVFRQPPKNPTRPAHLTPYDISFNAAKMYQLRCPLLYNFLLPPQFPGILCPRPFTPTICFKGKTTAPVLIVVDPRPVETKLAIFTSIKFSDPITIIITDY